MGSEMCIRDSCESAEQEPGRGPSGTLASLTGSQLELAVSCSLKEPEKEARLSLSRNTHTALPPMAFCGVVKTAYTSCCCCDSCSCFDSCCLEDEVWTMELVDSVGGNGVVRIYR